MMDRLWQDAKYAVRSLRRTPGFTAAAVITLALGIGANATIFTLLDAVLFKPLPVSRPSELFALYESSPDAATRCRTRTAERDVTCASRIRDSCELFFDREDSRLYVVKVQLEPTISVGTPVALPIKGFMQGGGRRMYDITPDGKQFLMLFR